MLKFFLIMIYIIPVLLVVFFERKRPTEAMLWVIILLCIPYIGTVFYLAFGSTISIKITAFLRKNRLNKRLPEVSSMPHYIQQAGLSKEDLDVMRFNSVYNESRVTCYEKADIFTTGESHYEALFRDIKNAKECIYIEFYTIHNDIVGHSLVKALAQKAEEGVKVFVMCDFIANVSSPRKMFLPIKKAGGKFIRIKPYITHYRSHRKIVAIDHRISYIGGMNVGKQYANMHKKKNPWRDTQVRLEGACTLILEDFFLKDWICAIHRRDIAQTLSYTESLTPGRYELNDNLCQFITGGVDDNKESIKMCYFSMIKSAQNRIRIQSPYFIPDASILDALKTAVASGIELEIMIPGVKAGFFLDPVTNYYCGQLLEYGAKVYKYEGYIHAKTMTVDDDLCCIGSVNMDMRSLMVDDEVCGVFYADALVHKYIDIFEKDKLSTKPYTWGEFYNRSQKERFAESIFLPFAPLM